MPRTSWIRTSRAERRPPTHLRVLALALSLMACVVSWSACESQQHDISVQSVQLATGEYYGLAWGGTQVERFHVLAHSGTKDGDVVIISPQKEEPCSLGPLSGYMPLQPANGSKYVIGSPSPARIGLFGQQDEDGRGLLSFSDVECKRTPLEVPDTLPSSIRHLDSLDLMQITLAIPTKEQDLLYIDPWAGTEKSVADDVTGLRPHEDGVWLIEHGAAVKRDHEGLELARFGNGVRELLPLGKGLDLAYVDLRGLFLHQDAKTTKIETDACKVRSLSGFLPKALGYFSPCADRTLQVRKQDGTHFNYDPPIDDLYMIAGRMLFTSHVDDELSLWMALPGAPTKPKLLFKRTKFDLDNLWSITSGKLLIASREADDTVTLWLLNLADAKPELEEFDEGVVSVGLYEDGLAIGHADGKLELRDRIKLHLLMSAKGVAKSGFRFLFGERATALAYAEHVDDETKLGTLAVHFLTGEQFTIAQDVREFREVWWPERGVLYAKGGEDAGVFFARIDVPCEKVSSSPWACGF